MILKFVVLVSCFICLVFSGCRAQERNACESICQQDSNGKMTCELRGAIILPNSPVIEASLPRVLPVIEIAEKKIRADKILPDYLKISWDKYDDDCDAAFATMSVISAYAKNCSHFIVGPSCEYSLSSVSRIAKYFYNDGLNIITGGGFSYDFVEPKKNCDDQFYMLHRVGILSFERMASLMTDLMHKFYWKRAAFVYERDGYLQVGGIQTCRLMMSSLAKSFNEAEGKIAFTQFDMDFSGDDIVEKIKRDVGNEHSTMVTGAAVVSAVGAFVFWPSSKSKLRQRRGQVSGLINFGNTCFVNSLLQALASSPQFLTWLQLHDSLDKKSLISSLQVILDCVNGTHPTIRADPSNPAPVIRALNSLGWVIPESENDVHELLHVILSSIEEESMKPKQVGCSLSDALDDAHITAISHPMPCRPSSAMLTEFDKDLYKESSNLMRLVRSEAQTPESNQSTVDENESIDHALFDDDNRNPSLQDSPPSIISTSTGRPARTRNTSMSQSNDPYNKNSCGSYRSLDRLSRGPGRVSVWSEKITKKIPPPFCGSISSQLMCTSCNYKSVVRVDKFDSITLNLPEQKGQTLLNLGQLLGEYVAPETVHDVECESCNKISNHTKTLTFTKLPPCLAIHISRSNWTNGQLAKRQDFVHFPESLSMAPYSFIQPSLGSNCSTPWGSTMSLYSASLANATPTNENVQFGSPFSPFGMFPRNLYRLLAVVVHGEDGPNSGHFITYRRGSLRNYHKWYYTSDHFVKEVSIEEVLASPAYMLFYDRSQSRN